MKKIIGIGMAVIMVGAMAVPTLARNEGRGQYRSDFSVVLDGTAQTFTRADGQVACPVLYNGTTYLPLRAVGEVMGKNVNWNENTKTIDIGGTRAHQTNRRGNSPAWERKDVGIQERKDFTIKIDGVTQSFTGTDGTTIYPIVCEGSTYLPLRAIGKVMGKDVAWDNETKTVALAGATTVTDADTFSKGQTQGDIGVGRAKEIALAHAKLREKDVRFTKTKMDREDGGKVYEVEFYYGNEEYDYDIHAVSGEILSFDKDLDDINSVVNGKIINEEKAKKAAFDHAGVKNSDVKTIQVVQKKDDGYEVYEIDFYTATMEYDYTIDAIRGIVLEYSQEKLNVTGATKQASTQTAKAVSLEEAKTIALAHAGLRASQATFTKTETDTDDGVKEYEFEFYSGKFEYECTVNASTGKVIDYDKDNFD